VLVWFSCHRHLTIVM